MKCICIVTVLFLLPFSGWSGTFLETFDGKKVDGWQELVQLKEAPGSWEIVNDELHAVSPDPAMRLLTIGDETWEDYEPSAVEGVSNPASVHLDYALLPL